MVVSGIRGHIARQFVPENECIKKPGGMAQVPFRWTYIGHGLHNVILRYEGFTECFIKLPGLVETLDQFSGGLAFRGEQTFVGCNRHI